VGRSGRRTRAWARALHASVGEAVEAARAPHGDGDRDADDYPADDAGEPERPITRMARRRFTL
jgi:hypothetical protein